VAIACGSGGFAGALSDGEVGIFEADAEPRDVMGLDVSIVPAELNVCAGQCVALSAQASGGVGPYSYRWDAGAAADGGSLEVCPEVTTTYTVEASDSSGRFGELGHSSASGTARATVTVASACDAEAPADGDGALVDTATDTAVGTDSPVDTDAMANVDADAAEGGSACVASGGPLLSGCESIDVNIPPFQACANIITLGAWGCLQQPLREGQSYSIVTTISNVVVIGTPQQIELSGSEADCTKTQVFTSQMVTGSGTLTFPSCVTAAANYPAVVWREINAGFNSTTWKSVTVQICSGCGAE
jgi:hypothetical protein